MSVPGKKGRRPPRYPMRAVGDTYRSVPNDQRGFVQTYIQKHRSWWKPRVEVEPRRGPFRRRERRTPSKPK